MDGNRPSVFCVLEPASPDRYPSDGLIWLIPARRKISAKPNAVAQPRKAAMALSESMTSPIHPKMRTPNIG
jgi:hypothetical protein